MSAGRDTARVPQARKRRADPPPQRQPSQATLAMLRIQTTAGNRACSRLATAARDAPPATGRLQRNGVDELTERMAALDIQDPNVVGLGNNCYYATVAGILGATVTDVVGATETMQHATGTVDDTADLIRATNLGDGGFDGAPNAAGAAALLQQHPGVRFAVGFRRADGTGHMVEGWWDRTTNRTYLHDHQIGRAADYGDVNAGTGFWLFRTNRRRGI